jgi:hypothetical protein
MAEKVNKAKNGEWLLQIWKKTDRDVLIMAAARPTDTDPRLGYQESQHSFLI